MTGPTQGSVSIYCIPSGFTTQVVLGFEDILESDSVRMGTITILNSESQCMEMYLFRHVMYAVNKMHNLHSMVQSVS